MSPQEVKDIVAGIAQLVEHNLAKVGVASSSLVSRSRIEASGKLGFFFRNEVLSSKRTYFGDGKKSRLGGRVVMQRPAKPWTPVRFRPQPFYLFGIP